MTVTCKKRLFTVFPSNDGLWLIFNMLVKLLPYIQQFQYPNEQKMTKSKQMFSKLFTWIATKLLVSLPGPRDCPFFLTDISMFDG